MPNTTKAHTVIADNFGKAYAQIRCTLSGKSSKAPVNGLLYIRLIWHLPAC